MTLEEVARVPKTTWLERTTTPRQGGRRRRCGAAGRGACARAVDPAQASAQGWPSRTRAYAA
eukprot:14794376-Alexandrium_andersonii.AAC.1